MQNTCVLRNDITPLTKAFSQLHMLFHIPVGNELLAASITLKYFNAGVLSQVCFEVGPGGVLFGAAFLGTVEFVLISMRFQMVYHYLRSFELFPALWEGACDLGQVGVRGHVVFEVLIQFEPFAATRFAALELSLGQMRNEVLTQSARHLKNLLAIIEDT